ncbi:hypothetical protein BGW42_002371 [Actinomortierella wolfii]|nr:hypothetical protein BGW42_002371 [Actinomortierella wolfii]
MFRLLRPTMQARVPTGSIIAGTKHLLDLQVSLRNLQHIPAIPATSQLRLANHHLDGPIHTTNGDLGLNAITGVSSARTPMFWLICQTHRHGSRRRPGFNSRRDIQRRMRYNILTGWITNDEMSSDSRLRAWIEAPTTSFNPRPEHHDMFPQFYFADSTDHAQAVTTADSGTVGHINGEHPFEQDQQQQQQQQQQQHGYQIKPPGGALEMRELEQHPPAVEGDNGSASTAVNPTS